MQPLSVPGRKPTLNDPADPLTAEALKSHAKVCEAAGFGQQASCIVDAVALLGPSFRSLIQEPVTDMVSRAQGHAVAGAYESAVLALMPASATFTGGRLAGGAVIAQVVLGTGPGAHSRDARWLAMAWLAALLRATAGQIETNTQKGPAQ